MISPWFLMTNGTDEKERSTGPRMKILECQSCITIKKANAPIGPRAAKGILFWKFWLVITVWVHIYSNPSHYSFHTKWITKCTTKNSAHWKISSFTALSGPLCRPLHAKVIHPGIKSAFLLLQQLLLGDPLPMWSYVGAEEEALAQLGGWHGVPPPHAAYLGPLARPDPRYIVSFFSFLRWQIAWFLLDLSSSLIYAFNALNFPLNTALIVSHTFW